jgi:hypothetical protein
MFLKPIMFGKLCIFSVFAMWHFFSELIDDCLSAGCIRGFQTIENIWILWQSKPAWDCPCS